MFFLLYLVQAGLFFTIPLFLSVSLGLSALDTGLRILPLSVTLLAAAVGIPRFFPDASPRRVVRFGLLAMFLGVVVLLAAMDANGRPDRHGAVVACRAGDRRARLAVGRGDRVRSTRRGQSGGRWSAEHCHQPRRRARDRFGRLDPHRLAQRSVPAGCRATRRSRNNCRSRPPPSWPPACHSCPTPNSRPRSPRPGYHRMRRRRGRGRQQGSPRRGPALRASVLALIAMIGLFAARRIPREPRAGHPQRAKHPRPRQE